MHCIYVAGFFGRFSENGGPRAYLAYYKDFLSVPSSLRHCVENRRQESTATMACAHTDSENTEMKMSKDTGVSPKPPPTTSSVCSTTHDKKSWQNNLNYYLWKKNTKKIKLCRYQIICMCLSLWDALCLPVWKATDFMWRPFHPPITVTVHIIRCTARLCCYAQWLSLLTCCQMILRKFIL